MVAQPPDRGRRPQRRACHCRRARPAAATRKPSHGNDGGSAARPWPPAAAKSVPLPASTASRRDAEAEPRKTMVAQPPDRGRRPRRRACHCRRARPAAATRKPSHGKRWWLSRPTVAAGRGEERATAGDHGQPPRRGSRATENDGGSAARPWPPAAAKSVPLPATTASRRDAEAEPRKTMVAQPPDRGRRPRRRACHCRRARPAAATRKPSHGKRWWLSRPTVAAGRGEERATAG